jgi:FtsP/CotA-like multicopper oxidase with cupredoxin domain
VLGGAGADVPAPAQPTSTVDLLGYGTPAPVGFDPATAVRHFEYSVGHRPGFVDGRPGLWWSVNGHLYPHIPMMMVSEGDVVVVHLENHSGEVHPMHLHGHHAVVLSRNGVAATGSPWWFDSLNVADGESYDVAFVADNPGIWMDHCHNLQHAADGMIVHLMYTGVTTPYVLGGPGHNRPE